jgi:hypothetical protein
MTLPWGQGRTGNLQRQKQIPPLHCGMTNKRTSGGIDGSIVGGIDIDGSYGYG